jgi:tagatose-1,6-bisphosphate aldolase
MITSNTKISAVVVTAPRTLTKEQRENVRVEVAASLPATVGVIVLDPGFAVTHIGDASILAELHALRADLAAQHEERTIAARPFYTSE